MFGVNAHRYKRNHTTDQKLFKLAFEFADKQKNGYLNKSELKLAYLVVFGCKPSKFDVVNILQKYGRKVSQSVTDVPCPVIDFEAFEKIVTERTQYLDADDDIREAFQILDARCKGFVDFDDFKKLVNTFLPSFDSLRIRRIFSEADRDNDGRVSFRDFQVLMNNDDWQPI